MLGPLDCHRYIKVIVISKIVISGFFPIHLTFEGGGGWKNWFVQEFLFLTGQCFSFTVKASQEICFSNLPPPPSRVKWSAPYIGNIVISRIVKSTMYK